MHYPIARLIFAAAAAFVLLAQNLSLGYCPCSKSVYVGECPCCRAARLEAEREGGRCCPVSGEQPCPCGRVLELKLGDFERADAGIFLSESCPSSSIPVQDLPSGMTNSNFETRNSNVAMECRADPPSHSPPAYELFRQLLI